MADDLWDKPVELMIESSDHFHTVGNAREAVACLMTRWPTARDNAFAEARKLCMKAVDGTSSSDQARAAFIAAAQTAGILRQ